MARNPKPHRLTLNKRQLIDYAEDLENQIAHLERREVSLMTDRQFIAERYQEARSQRDHFRTLSSVRGEMLMQKDGRIRSLEELRACERRSEQPENVGSGSINQEAQKRP